MAHTSFSSAVKNEISKLETEQSDSISELSALIRNIGIVDTSIRVTTENASVARRIFTLVKELYKINSKIVVRRGYNFKKNYLYIIEINHKVQEMIEMLSINTQLGIPSSYIVDDNDLVRAYLRGLFMSVGSVNDPKKSRYHLEFLVDNKEYANFIKELLNKYYLNSKVLKRESKYMVYIKEAERIGDFLRIISASNAVLYFEDIRIYRDHKNMTNRLNNCEQANVDKMILTASNQVKDIELINEKASLDLIDDKVKVVAEYRIKYPEVSLSELSEIISIETGNKITKSGINHRMKKIKELANKIRLASKNTIDK